MFNDFPPFFDDYRKKPHFHPKLLRRQNPITTIATTTKVSKKNAVKDTKKNPKPHLDGKRSVFGVLKEEKKNR
jgi:hypothetical protein